MNAPLPGDLRAALMRDDIVLIVAVRPRIWREAFAAEGLHWLEDDGSWVVGKDGGKRAVLDPLEVQKLLAGLLTGVSPRASAAAVRQRLEAGS